MKSLLKPLAFALLLTTPLLHAAEEWSTLFDGKDTSKWQNAAGQAPGGNWVVENGTLTRKDKGGDIWTKQRFGDFVLELEFKTTGNSGIFIRTDKPQDNVQTGIEVQVDRPGGPEKHSVGAIYDLVAPTKNVAKDDWNKVVITAKGKDITVEMNGEKINAIDLDRWTKAGENPDGSKNKFGTALKDFKREGHIGLQDHGNVVSYRNIRVRTL